MTAREERARKAGSGDPPRSTSADVRAAGRSIGWGFGREGERDGNRMRRAIFTVAAVSMGGLGAVFLVWTLAVGGRGGRILTANSSPGRPAGSFTVKLLEFPSTGPKRQDAERLCAMAPVRTLAGSSEFHFVSLPGGRMALCVGRFERRDSPELLGLLRGFQEYADRGNRVFPAASILDLSR
jgi:hypothetical protein